MVSRSELHRTACKLGWHWYEAPLYAVLDLLTVRQPISRQLFSKVLQDMAEDPMGPYGKVLLQTAHFVPSPISTHPSADFQNPRRRGPSLPITPADLPQYQNDVTLFDILSRHSGRNIAKDYNRLVDTLASPRIATTDAALLIIDPQRSFTSGVWKESIGVHAASEVEPIGLAFESCTALLAKVYHLMPVMFSRCPFPPTSYDWDDRLKPLLDEQQLYFLKPGNSILFPPLNGYSQWVSACRRSGKRLLVMGGCTLNSCVRVSAIDTQIRFGKSDLQVIVDLSICGARSTNYGPSPQFGGHSAVASAIHQMIEAGVRVVHQIRWK